MKAYRVAGTTDEVTNCELCGRDELKGTVVLEPIDADGNGEGVYCYFGSSCAAKAAGWTQREITRRVKEAADTKRAEEKERRDAEHAAQMTFVRGWYLENYGTEDAWEAAKLAGTTAPRLSDRALAAYRESLREATPATTPPAAGTPAAGTPTPVRRVCDRPRCTRPAPATDLYCSQACYELDNDDVPVTVSFRGGSTFAGLHWQLPTAPVRHPLGRR